MLLDFRFWAWCIKIIDGYRLNQKAALDTVEPFLFNLMSLPSPYDLGVRRGNLVQAFNCRHVKGIEKGKQASFVLKNSSRYVHQGSQRLQQVFDVLQIE